MESAGEAVVGLTSVAGEQLGEIVHVALPPVGRKLRKDDEAAVLESVKAAAEFRSPLSGTVTGVNGALAAEPRRVSDDPTGSGWLFTLRLDEPEELHMLMDEATYRRSTGKGG